ncbi:macro domain-containing protein [Prosthecobacter sp. SYSU 5D2]|uniref:type II toxin-antitoxin system antitoxin DNA ADP-ribosyl glycohydrolase DarG n=1 Tax=Prosthecobacter sp. SYSU 5D2 TaxID=3134134 RepID=UPI0031FF1402
MIEFTQGNLLEARAEALVNTVNTQGVMGKGIALQFKQAFPTMYREYERACAAGEVELGKMHVVDLGGLVGGPRWIINFPTKGHWRARSKITDVDKGLQDLVRVIRANGIRSIALPPLGCGLGGLDWNDVRPRIEAALSQVPEVKALVFAPGAAPAAEAMPNRTERPKMTIGQAALIALMDRYLKGLLDPFVSLLEIHKLLYFLQAAGQPLRLKYTAQTYGPYATNLRQVLIRMEKHYTQGYGDGRDTPTKPIELLPGAVEQAEAFLAADSDTVQRMNCVTTLIEGYEDGYGLELLSSVHWVMTHQPAARTDADVAVRAVQSWNTRKNRTLKEEHLLKAWHRLTDFGWDKAVNV